MFDVFFFKFFVLSVLGYVNNVSRFSNVKIFNLHKVCVNLCYKRKNAYMKDFNF